MFRGRLAGLMALALLIASGGHVGAQPFDQAGVRAMGFGGAFVAVADDASAVWWNPAGLASGPFFNVILERQARRREPSDTAVARARAAIDQTVTGFAIGTPPLGLSYFRTRHTVVPAGETATVRQTHREVSSLVAHHTGITLLHSMTAGFVVGSTLKLVRGVAAASPFCPEAAGDCTETPGDALDRAAELIGRATNRFDADVGVHWISGVFRAGVTVRHLAEPAFATVDGEEIVLQRQARVGVALGLGGRTTVAADVDVTENDDDPSGRRVALGVEHRWLSRLSLRAGLRVATGEEADRAGSIGASVAVRPGVWLDGFWSQGDYDDGRWGVAARVAY